MKGEWIWIGFVVTLVIAWAGCDRYLPTREPRDTPPEPVPVPEIVFADYNGVGVELTWQVAEPSSISLYRVFQSETVAGPFAKIDSTKGQMIVVDNLLAGQTYWFRVAAVSRRSIEGDPSIAISVTVSKVAVDNGEGGHYIGRDHGQ
jgi:hypothetical protein